jgi:hypothetical protein
MIEAGKWPAKPPIGYVKEQGWVKVAEAGAQITQAFQEFSTGYYTLDTWADKAYYELGITSSNGKKIRPSSWSSIFHNRFYIGTLTWSGKQATGNHIPLVDPETFERVQQILLANHNGGVNKQYRSYLLSGLLWSNDADCPMYGTVAKSGQCFYYRSKKPMPSGVRHHVSVELLDQQIAQVLQGVSVRPDSLDNIPGLDESMDLAMKIAPSVGAVYQWLKLDEQRRGILDMVIAPYGLKVFEKEIVDVVTLQPFERIGAA